MLGTQAEQPMEAQGIGGIPSDIMAPAMDGMEAVTAAPITHRVRRHLGRLRRITRRLSFRRSIDRRDDRRHAQTKWLST